MVRRRGTGCRQPRRQARCGMWHPPFGRCAFEPTRLVHTLLVYLFLYFPFAAPLVKATRSAAVQRA